MTEPTSCTRCGTPLAPGAHFCSRCGFDVSGVQGGLATAKMAAPPEDDPQAGLIEELRRATLGDYEIAGELGRGGMATVFLAHDIALDRKVAIKVMSPSLTQSGGGMADRFKREARTAAALSHPHIIPIYGVKVSGRLLYFIMKFVQGRSLDAIVKEHGALPIKMVQAILAQSGGALDYAHRHGIIHRDIKPANIMLDIDGWAVVTDFGIAKVTESQGLTMTGATIGTPTYMSPEQCAAREITGATDQYSLGIAAYEMLTGKVPFEADSMMSLMWMHFHEPPPPILERRPDCPPELAHAIERMLAKAPADRWPTLEEAVEAIGTPAHNDPIRQQMRAFARGKDASHISTEHHTPMSPVPKSLTPPAGGTAAPPVAPAPSKKKPVAPPPRNVTAAPTTPIPATPTAPEVQHSLPVTPVEPISPPVTHEFAESPTSVIETPVPKLRSPPPPAPAPPRPAPPKPPVRRPPAQTGSMPGGRSSRAEPAPVIPAPYATRRSLSRFIGPGAVLIAVGVVAWMLLGRNSAAPPPAPATPVAVAVSSVTVTPSPAAVAVGRSAQLAAVLKDGSGNLLSGRTVTWTSTDSSMARVSPTGLVTAVSPGYVTVTATSEGHAGTGTVMITATAAVVASVTLTRPTAAIELGDTAAFSAAPKDDHGNTLAGHAIIWSTSDRRIATVSSTGTVAGLRLGTVTVVVAVGGKRDSARVTIVPPAVAMVVISPPAVSLQVGGRTQLAASARDVHDRPIAGRQVEWRSSNPSVATVADGAVTALREGQVSITALIESRSASASVTINAVPVASLAVTPRALTLAVGKTQQLNATPRDARGGSLRDRQISWTSSDASVASVSPAGAVTAVSGGTATITATSEGVSGTSTLTVPAPATPVVVTPPPTPPAGKTDTQPTNVQPPQPPPTPVTGGTDDAAARAVPRRGVAAGASHSCGITQSGAVSCWGGNANGQLGAADAGAQVLRPLLVAQTSGFNSLVAGVDFTCGLTSGTAVCWGVNLRGQLGIGRVGKSAEPTPVAGNHGFASIIAGSRHACGLGADGVAWCWGDNSDGQLGTGNTRGLNTPQRVSGGVKFKALAAGDKHTCGLTDAGKVYCWGDGFSGQLGRGGRETLNEPGPVDLTPRIVAIAAGSEHTCALALGGKIYCWGANVAGEIGDGSKTERDSPVPVSRAGTFSGVTAGTGFTCAITDGGDAYCWGRNREGQLGDGSHTDRQTPVKVALDQAVQFLSAGAGHACGVTRDQRVLCWGGNARGQLGDGTQAGRSTPAPVP